MLIIDAQIPIGLKSIELQYQFEPLIYGIYGPNGIGKTSFFHALSGINVPVAGLIKLNKDVWFDSSIRVKSPQERQVGIVFQNKRLFPHLTVKKNILFGAKKGNVELFKETIEVLQLESLLNKFPNEISGGEQQRVAIARVIMQEPQLLLFDEAFNAIDKDLLPAILKFIKSYQQRSMIPIIAVGHQMELLQELADNVIPFEALISR